MTLGRWEVPPPEKSGALEEEIERRVQKSLREMDREIVERLRQRYGHLVPPERIRRMKDAPTVFEDRKEFDRRYIEATEAEPPSDKRVVGFSRGLEEPAHVALDQVQIPKAIAHERLHQMSDPRAEERMGKKLYEGATEDFAIKAVGSEPVPELPKSYAQERVLARRIGESCGEKALEHAYFRGDVSELRECLERRLGKDNLERLRKAARELPPIERPL